MQPFTIHTTLTIADWHALQRACALRLQQQGGTWWRAVAIWVAISFGSFALIDALGVELSWLSMVVGVVFCAAVMLESHRRSLDAMMPREGSSFLSPYAHEFSGDGIVSSQRGVRALVQWQRVSDVTATAEHIFVWLDTVSAYVIPVRDLAADMTAEQMIARCKEWMADPVARVASLGSYASAETALSAGCSDVAMELQFPPATAAAGESTWQTVFRLLTLRSVEHPGRPGRALSGKTTPIMLLASLSLLLWTGVDWFDNHPEPHFFPYNIPTLAWYVLAALAVAVTMAKRSHPQIALSRVCMLVAILLPILIVADFAITMFVPERWVDAVRIALGLYALVYCARGLHALTGARQPAAVLGGFSVAAMFLWLTSALYVYPGLWTARDAHDNEIQRDADETLLFEQPARIDAAVAQIERASGETPAGFFVGFAGYGEQRVFAEEIKFAARTFAGRYDTADRTLLLINDRRDRQTQPLATVSGLRYALKAVASKMRLDQDVLFLALSSHGSEDPLLSVENGTLPLRDLTGDALAEALRASGIKWRVIVISACHAGAFIEPLRDPYTVVITAAAPERTSFGCSDERDLTYFGEAFFRDSLPQAASLREAFETATKLVGEREREQGVDASHPQAFFGADIEQRIVPMLRAASAP